MQKEITFKAGEAFGAGNHPSTAMALEMLQELAGLAPQIAQNEPHNPLLSTPLSVLDMGCGSGLLALAAAHLLPHGEILAADIDPAAVQATHENAKANGLEARITALRSDGFSHPAIHNAAPYGLLIANVLPDPLIQWMPDIQRSTAAGGWVILSGILLWRKAELLITAHAHRLSLAAEMQADDWCCLLLKQE